MDTKCEGRIQNSTEIKIWELMKTENIVRKNIRKLPESIFQVSSEKLLEESKKVQFS